MAHDRSLPPGRRGTVHLQVGGLVEQLPPDAFSFVMATGIVSTALHLEHQTTLSTALLVVAIVGGLALLGLLVARLARFPRSVLHDAADPERAFGFFTIVAALNVLGVRLAVAGHQPYAVGLAAASVPAWLLLTYAIPGGLMLGRRTEPVVDGVNGSWFLWVVATQSLGVAGATIGHTESDLAQVRAAAAVSLWGIGVVLYLMLVGLVTLRLLSLPANPHAFSPTYWIYMGATAITVLTGSRILDLPSQLPVLRATIPVISGLTFLLWAFGTWWIPLLLVFGFWRHGLRREPLHYEAGLWGMVFPLGMYAVGSLVYGQREHLPFMVSIGTVVVWIAFAAWLLVAIGMIHHPLRHHWPQRLLVSEQPRDGNAGEPGRAGRP